MTALPNSWPPQEVSGKTLRRKQRTLKCKRYLRRKRRQTIEALTPALIPLAYAIYYCYVGCTKVHSSVKHHFRSAVTYCINARQSFEYNHRITLSNLDLRSQQAMKVNQESSSFLRLPAEIRQQIYEYFFDHIEVAIVSTQSKFSRKTSGYTLPNDRRYFRMPHWTSTPEPFLIERGVIDLPLTCRRIYSESIDILYSRLTFVLTGPSDLFELCHLLLPQRLNVLTSLRFDLSGFYWMHILRKQIRESNHREYQPMPRYLPVEYPDWEKWGAEWTLVREVMSAMPKLKSIWFGGYIIEGTGEYCTSLPSFPYTIPVPRGLCVFEKVDGRNLIEEETSAEPMEANYLETKAVAALTGFNLKNGWTMRDDERLLDGCMLLYHPSKSTK
ncbi:MAG: hypothetical protein M1820_005412 [Bogoriella megaspora]|nr:MAG: hypothetical protein M1820_005412 [Bogoriella megaspora]